MANSPLLQIPQLAPSQSAKETTINDGFSILERSLNDIREVDLSSGDVELNITDYTRAFMFNVSGAAVPRTLTVPASKRLFAVYNSGTDDVTVEAKDSVGMTAEIPVESFVVLFNDGVDIRKISDSAASGQVSAFLSLPDTPNDFTGHAGEAMVVNGTEDGLTFGTISVSFTQLTDAPSDYTSHAGKVIRVNGTEDGVEFGTYIDTFLALTDTPEDYIGHAGRIPVVTSLEDGLEFIDIPERVVKVIDVTLSNGGFEDGDLTNWTAGTGTWLVAGTFGVVTDPFEGNFFAYYDVEQGDAASSLSYDIDLLADGATEEELDASPTLEIYVAIASPWEDYGSVEVEFFDELDSTLGTDTSPTYEGTVEFVSRRFRTTIPATARSATITLHATKNVGSSEPDDMSVCFDDLRVQIKSEVEQIQNFLELIDTPSSFSGMAGRTVKVNAGEDALEFVDDPVVPEYLNDLVDFPSSYTGEALKFLRVNSGETAVEFAFATFLQLADAPSSFSGHGEKFVKVNAAENALEFVASSTGSSVFTINDQTDDYTLVIGDGENTYVRVTKGSAVNLTVPPNASVAFPIGTTIAIRQGGTGQLTIVEGSGVTVNTAETLNLRKQHSGATLIKVATDEWDLVGDLELVA